MRRRRVAGAGIPTFESAGGEHMIAKLQFLFGQRSFLIFLIIGAGNTLLTIALSQALLGPLGEWGATAVGYAIPSAISFVLNRRFSFKSKGDVLSDLWRFALVVAACYVVSNALAIPAIKWLFALPALEGIRGWALRVALLAANVLFSILNYFGQRFFAFPNQEAP